MQVQGLQTQVQGIQWASEFCLSACCSYDSYCIHTVHFLMLILVASRQQPAPEVLALAFGIGAYNYAESNFEVGSQLSWLVGR